MGLSSAAWLPLIAGLIVGTAVTDGLVTSAHAAPRDQVSKGQVGARAASHSGRRNTRASRRPRNPGRRAPAIPWMKGNLPNVQAAGAFVLDLADGQELYARKADEPRPIASISKLAATLTIMDRGLRLDGLTTITRGDIDVARGGARSRLFEGMTLSNRDLLHAALLGSDNRAIPALGRAVGLDPTQLAAAMTAKVHSLGLRHTSFVEPTGLSPQNVSTPREIVDLLRAVMDHPVLAEVTRTVDYEAHPVGRPALRYSNTYRAAARANTHVLGGKTGFNNAARYCLVVAARIGGRTLGMAFLGTEGEMTRFGDVARVADWVVMQESRQSAPRTLVASVPPGTVRTSPASPAGAAPSPAPSFLGPTPLSTWPSLLPAALPSVAAQLAPPPLAPLAAPTGVVGGSGESSEAR